MNKFKKLIVGALVVASASALCGAAACSETPSGGEPAYYELKFEGKGLDYIYLGELAEMDEFNKPFQSGGTVKEGVEVRFSVLLGANSTGTPIITANGDVITPDANNEYFFIMNEDTVVSASGLGTLYSVSLLDYEKVPGADGQYYEEERRVKYFDLDGKEINDEKITVNGGGDFKFKIWISPYYKSEFTVTSGYDVLVPDKDGIYSINEIDGDKSVSVNGLILDDAFPNRSGCGDGTANNPWQISRPIDLYYLAALTNSGDYGSRYSAAHYKLTGDIDMNGEQIFVIGDNSNDAAVFMGVFDGNGHKISNFYVTDEVVDQESFNREHLPYVGVFGTVSASTIGPAAIKNVSLEDFSTTAHPGAAGAGAYVGGLVGYGIGVEISNCKVNGSVLAIGDNNQLINMGGIAGRLQGAYRQVSRSEIITYDSFVYGSSAEILLEGTGSPRSAGGLVGYLVSADISAVAYVANSYSKGNVAGAMHAGGIVGTVGRFSSVANCYSDADVNAQNSITSGNASSDYLVAYAGGIAGYAEESAVISACYSANYTSASDNKLSAISIEGKTKTGATVGETAVVDDGAADLTPAVLFNNATAVSGNPVSVFTDTLGWISSEWDFEGALPEIVSGPVKNYTVKVLGANEIELGSFSDSMKAARPVYSWYYGEKLPEYFTFENGRSWGYFFDKELTQKVPYGFIPSAQTNTFYVGLADYSEIAGTYHLRATEYSDGAYLQLTEDGRALLRNGGLHHECSYSYNGDTITLYASALATLSYSNDQVNGGYFAYRGTFGEEGLGLRGLVTLFNSSGSAELGNQYTTEISSFTAVKETAGFEYGEYIAANGIRYVFRKNGSGSRISTGGTAEFTYTVTEEGGIYTVDTSLSGAAAITMAGGKIDTIGGIAVSLKDKFAGSWKVSANSSVVFSFDGIDKVTYTQGDDSVTENYEIRSGVAEFIIDGNQYKASFQNGTLVINGADYYVSDTFTGNWFITGAREQIDIALEGVGAEGYGYATLTYSGGITTTFDAQYDVFSSDGVSVLRIYVGDMQYGELVYNRQTGVASGVIHSLLVGNYINADMYLYDSFKGVWVSSAEGIDTVTFNGRSANASSAEAVLRAPNGKVTSGKYSLSSATSGTLTAGGITYGITYNESENSVTLNAGETAPDEKLARRDGWYNVVLHSGGTTYTFDGKSGVGGKVAVRNGGTLTQELEYTLSGETVTLGGYALTPNANGFDWNGTALEFDSGFANRWLVSGADGILEIGKIDGWFKANVTYNGGEAVGFTYEPQSGALVYTQDVDGERIVTSFKLAGTKEMNIVRNGGNVNAGYNCLIEGNEDSWKGIYRAADGSSWKFDGLGDCRYGSGTAVYTPATGEPVKYSYMNNVLGMPYLSGAKNFVFTQADGGEDGYIKDGDQTAYKAVETDSYYARTVYTNDGGRRNYFFDGLSNLWLKEGETYTKAYTYTIATNYKAELTDLSGKKFNAVMQETGMSVLLTISEQMQAVEGEGSQAVIYSFSVTGILWKIVNGGYEKAYNYEVIDKDKGQYELTDVNGKLFDAVVKGSETSGYTITITEQKEQA